MEHKLFRNLGKFQDVSKEAGLRVAPTDEESQQLTWLTPKVRERLKRDVTEGDSSLDELPRCRCSTPPDFLWTARFN